MPEENVYPLLEARGSRFELGRQHGEQAAVKIRGYLEALSSGLKLSRESLRARSEQFRPLFRRHCPRLLDEVAGLAAGAGIDEREALALQLRGEVGQLADGGCTTFVVGRSGTANGETLIGQNSDNPPELMDYGYMLRLIPDDGPRMLMWTFGGMLGYHGVNEHGVAHFANSLGGGPGWRFALSHYPLKRMILESRTLDDVRRLFRDVPLCSNGNYVLCDGAGNIADIEATSEGPFELPDAGEGFFAHSNHFLCGPHACEANHRQSLADSFPRQERMRTLIRNDFGSLSVERMREILSDHDGFPTGLCRHPHEGPVENAILPPSGCTVASLIAEPDRGRLHVSRGMPCENPFVTYSISD